MEKKAAIEIYLRLRPLPPSSPSRNYTLSPSSTEITFALPENNDYINNTQTTQNFKFSKIFPETSNQDEIFTSISKEIIDSALEGYNGTIFAYGQSGSGKTFTMTGGAVRYEDRGIIPRSVSYLFKKIREDKDKIFNVSVSYLEIYNNVGYDLLFENCEESGNRDLRDLPKVVPFMNKKKELILKNLSIQKAENEEDLLNTLFIGDTNRVVCETPLNDVSTRSHCIFTIYLESHSPNSEIKNYSKINLVDLSGSERIGKTGAQNNLLKEACNINLSLFFLEHVIINLQKKIKGEKIFVPYRNSLMTMMLKDSLGGNCKTKMISTIFPSINNLLESVSTCQFAQRVALIKNSVLRNKKVDANVLISRLKVENENLKDEIFKLKGVRKKEFLTKEDKDSCEEIVRRFLENDDVRIKSAFCDSKMVRQCFVAFKKLFKGRDKGFEQQVGLVEGNDEEDDEEKRKLEVEIEELKNLVLQKDREISSLLESVRKNEEKIEETEMKFEEYNQKIEKDIHNNIQNNNSEQGDNFKEKENLEKNSNLSEINKKLTYKNNYFSKSKQQPKKKENHSKSEIYLNPNLSEYKKIPISQKDLKDKKKCFEIFRKDSIIQKTIIKDQKALKTLYHQGKQIMQLYKKAKIQINTYKSEITFIRKKHMIENLMNDNKNLEILKQKEDKLRFLLKKENEVYKENYEKAKNVQTVIKGLHFNLEKNKRLLEREFKEWFLDVEKDFEGSERESFVSGFSKRTKDNLEAVNYVREKYF